MGTRGPQRVPTALLAARGSQLTSDRLATEPTPQAGVPQPPAGLDDEALAAWKEVSTLVEMLSVTTLADALALEQLARALAAYRRCHAELLSVGFSSGKSTTPAAKMLVPLSNQLLALCREFGLSPAARSRVTKLPETGDDEDDKAQFFPVVG